MREKLKVPVEEFTSPNPLSVTEDENMTVILKLMKDKKCRHIPVMREKNLVGIISDRDIYKSSLENPNYKDLKAKDLMTKDVYKVDKQENIDKVVFSMSDKKIGSALVEDENGSLYGIFTSTDALNAIIEIIRGDLERELWTLTVSALQTKERDYS